MNFLEKGIQDEVSFLNYLIEYPELCVEKCKERKAMLTDFVNCTKDDEEQEIERRQKNSYVRTF